MQSERPRAARRSPTELIWDALFFSLVIILLCLFALAVFPAFGAPRLPPPKVVAGLDRMIRQGDLRGGVTLIVFRDGLQLYPIDAGGIDPEATISICLESHMRDIIEADVRDGSRHDHLLDPAHA
jgi:hypothetical protein